MKNKFPPINDIKEMSKKLSKSEASATLPPHASSLEKLKYDLCKAFVRYKQIHNLSQRELAEKLAVNEAIISKIVHYKIEIFTVDRLMKYLSLLDSRVSIRIKVA